MKTTLLILIVAGMILINLMLVAQNNIHYSGDLLQRHNNNSIIILGDTQKKGFWEFWKEDNQNISRLIFDKIAKDDPAFLIMLGDVVCFASDEDHWNEFDMDAVNIRKKKIPVFPVLGNHEYFWNEEKGLGNYFSRFPHYKNSQWYSFVFKSIGFILLNSNFVDMEEGDINKQNEWYLDKLTEFKNDGSVKMVITVCHHPPYTNSKVVGENKEVEKYFVYPAFGNKKVKLFFSGHSHNYEHFRRNGVDFIVSGGGGAARHALITDSSKRRREDIFEGEEIRKFHYCKLNILEDGLQFRVVFLDEDRVGWVIGEEQLIPFKNSE